MSQIASVYAEALYRLAADEGLADRILGEISVLNEAFSQEQGFIRLLSTPSLSKEERLHIVDDSFANKVHPYLLNFIKILTEKGYMRHFSACYQSYRAQYNEEHGILIVTAKTAAPLSAAQAEKLSAKMAQITGKRIELQNVIDPACLGGVRLDYDGKRIDDTIRHRLDSMHQLLKNTVL